MSVLEHVVSNGYIPIIPILVWNLLFTSKLPEAYQPQSFNRNIPRIILTGEQIFRGIIFLLPICVRLTLTSSVAKTGFLTFLIGVVVYFSSWILLIYRPHSGWSKSLLGFIAPAYTPSIWLIGLSLMGDSYYFPFIYSPWHLIAPAIAFSAFHISHAVFVYKRVY